MSDILAQSLAIPGLWVMLATCFVAGLVYGFAGFGAALVFMPVGTIFLPVEAAIASFNLATIVSIFTVLPRALPLVDRRGTAAMVLCALPMVALGIWVLKQADVTLLRWAVIAVAAVTLVALVSGLRYRATPGPATRAAVAGATGFVGGSTGLLGPVLILFQLAGQDSVARSRATILVFLTITSTLLLPLMALQGALSPSAIPLGFLMFLPYGLGTKVGQALFDPAREGEYRTVSYLIIAAAILLGLPVWD
ncbi:sulfite exporter TauE/SafE family protein [Salipiger bermudensis]|uniref:sulfite exporter TauE/SafE family protein n=1 Tax=Salipiger bermudensis TaxID=344736 RepID=UPI001CD3D782|nr:sulfite exporter TauE/SafE family protein [Salipiger bermudensis]MCA1287651.1 sulfite exporter TauE/SafE family protein [Salipiger bermudensis]